MVSAISEHLQERQIGLYTPNYGDDPTFKEHGRLTQWNQALIRWRTQDGLIPLDNPKACDFELQIHVV